MAPRLQLSCDEGIYHQSLLKYLTEIVSIDLFEFVHHLEKQQS